MKRDDTLASIGGMLREVVDEEWIRDAEITMETRFNQDLGLESLEFVALYERLQGRYEGVDFIEWLSAMELEEISSLTVGDMVRFIKRAREG